MIKKIISNIKIFYKFFESMKVQVNPKIITRILKNRVNYIFFPAFLVINIFLVPLNVCAQSQITIAMGKNSHQEQPLKPTPITQRKISSEEVGQAKIPQGKIISRPIGRVDYAYYYKGELVVLNPSTTLIAIEDTGSNGSSSDFASTKNLKKDSLSENSVLKKKGVAIYRKAINKKDKSEQSSMASTLQSFSEATNQIIQPVFEQGTTILIPSDEIIVGFKNISSISEAREYLEANIDEKDIIELREHRKNTFILKIDKPTNGRVYSVCQFLTGLGEISFAEPNHIVVMQTEQGSMKESSPLPLGEMDVIESDNSITIDDLDNPPFYPFYDLPPGSTPQWTTIATLDFEEPTYPSAGWQVGNLSGGSSAYWGKTTYRAHSGTSSIYCAGMGSAGVNSPGPAPINMRAVLRSPTYDLSGFEEVYVELWFYTKNEINQSTLSYIDFPEILIGSVSTGSSIGKILGSLYAGDLSTEPTAQNGWLRCLYRVPPAYRTDRIFFDFRYISNSSNQLEGAYLDDIRIVGTNNLDTNLLGNDTYGARQYELENTGQIAGLGDDSNDMHIPEAWELVSVSPDVVVAVIDSGVDLTHPDLNLVTGYDPNGMVGGYHRGEYHGTACAGNVGAIKDNGIGVIGTAPGVKIMPVFRGETVAEFTNAIDVAVNYGANILSNSWGWSDPSFQDIENAINDAIAQNRVVLFAAGNGPDRPPFNYNVAFPGRLTGSSAVICVGAASPTDEHKGASSSDGIPSWGSSYVGAGPDIVAPGPWSYTTDIQGAEGYNDGSLIDPYDPTSADYNPTFGGTSSATPKVAGIVALMLSKNPNLTPAEVKSILRNTADDIDAPGVDDKTGAGRVNAHNAVLAVTAGTAKGSVSVTILPHAAILAGAQWRVDGGAWQNSAAVYSGLTPGTHTVDFKSIIGWLKPDNQEITVTTNYTTTSTATYTLLTGEQPNLVPYTPSAWSDKLVVTNVTGTSTDAASISPTDTIYIDWAAINNGTQIASNFKTTIFVDNVVKMTWITYSLNPNYYNYINDFSIGNLETGTHQIKIVTDSDNTVIESNENDNSYTKTITVGDVSSDVNLTSYQPYGWSDKIVISTVTGTTTDSPAFLTSDNIFIDFAFYNNGISNISDTFYTRLYVDNVFKQEWSTSSSMVGYYQYVTDFSLGSLGAGQHEFKIEVDTTNVIQESNENDNIYKKTIFVGGTSSNVNLTPYQPSGWSDKIVISTVTGTYEDSPTFSSTDDLYVDWAVVNNGTSDNSGAFNIKLYVDNLEKGSWTSSILNANFYTYYDDFSLGSLSPGSHQIKILVDPENSISEDNETDNIYTKTITVAGNNMLGNGDFESGHVNWIETNNANYYNVNNYPGLGLGNNNSDWFIYTGIENNIVSNTYQAVFIPENDSRVYVQFWYRLYTEETTSTMVWDTMAVQIINPNDGTVIDTLTTFSNLDSTADWVESPFYDLSGYEGQTILLNFHIATDATFPTYFLVDDVVMICDTIPKYSLNIQKAGSGVGSVTPNKGIITWSSNTGTAVYNQGTNIILTANPDTGSYFVGWSGACSGSSTCTVTMDEDKEITATFNLIQYSLAEAINNPDWNAVSGGDSEWLVDSINTYDGNLSAKSGDIGDSQSSWIQTTVTGPGVLSFWWKISSELNYDFLRFYLDDQEQVSVPGISGEVDWTKLNSIIITEGTHSIKWAYVKDISLSSSDDAGWIDQVVFTPIVQEFSLTVNKTGNGNGTITSNTGSLTWAGDIGVGNYANGIEVKLTASPTEGSFFAGWNGACIGDGECTILINSNKNVSAEFIQDLCPDDPEKSEPSICGCGVPETNTDGDGNPNCIDTDDDNDGMPDTWETEYGFNPLVNNANEDPDEDGFTNIQEYKRETDPNDPDSHPSRSMPWLPLLLE